ncbi:hypothetical protein C2G38_2075071 [Gigaspora rosea]|uniref:Uncharacterized protein n=1 Tax=Gigaspora rosea TaxID=44941 RepID=A0A397VNW3_9GLOM|nr:hypothetical protein C2G38_2075071 [Gigaspora rosea]
MNYFMLNECRQCGWHPFRCHKFSLFLVALLRQYKFFYALQFLKKNSNKLTFIN